MLLVANGQSLNSHTVATYGIGTEPMAFCRIVVIYKADATTADVFVRTHHTLHDVIELVRIVQVLLDEGSGILGCHHNF